MRRVSVAMFVCAAVLAVQMMAGTNAPAVRTAAPRALRLARIFSDGMVLQRQKRVPVWGWAAPGEYVTVRFAGQSVKAVADTAGKWLAWLAPLQASATGTALVVSGTSTTITLKGVVVGEVWICAGQSNMERIFQIDAVGSNYPTQKHTVATANYPNIRYFKPDFFTAPKPMDDFDQYRFHGLVWKPINAQTIMQSSSLPFYFAEQLHLRLNVPVGLVQLAVSGTPGWAWTKQELLEREFAGDLPRILRNNDRKFSEDKLGTYDDFVKSEAAWRAACAAAVQRGDKKLPVWPGHVPRMTVTGRPFGLYNALVHPAAPFAVRGVIWHQGEGGPYDGYDRLLRCLATQWRELHGADVCFIWGTLANFPPKPGARVPGIPEGNMGWLKGSIQGQIAAMRLLTNMAAGVNFQDLGNGELHWAAKDAAGYRMSLAARALCYGEKALVYNGPVADAAVTETNMLRITFSHAGSGLMLRNGAACSNVFATAGEDGVYQWAQATVAGCDLLLRSDKVAKPVSAVYAVDDRPILALFNKEGFPAASFYLKYGAPVYPYFQRAAQRRAR